MGGRPVPPEDIAEMRAMREAGLSQEEIAKHTGWSLRTVRNYTTHDQCRVPLALKPGQLEEIHALYAQGLTRPEIARRMGCSLSTIRRRGMLPPGSSAPLLTAAEVAEIRALRAEGLTQAEVAKRVGRGLRSVQHYTSRGRGSQKTTTPADIAEMLSLAAEGLSRTDIAAITGWSVKTVGKHVGHIVPRRDKPIPDLARYRRMLKAAEAAEYGMSDQIARRFGFKSAKVFWVRLAHVRRVLAEADDERKAA
jgi:DNA-binding CsgD family transcriptional regulator